MKYNISSITSPKMLALGNGTVCIKLLLTKVSKDMHDPLVPMLFPIIGAHVSGAEFQYPDLSWKEPCGMMANLVAESGGNKGQLSNSVEAICRDFRIHDEAELQKLVAWQKQVKTRTSEAPRPRRTRRTSLPRTEEMSSKPAVPPFAPVMQRLQRVLSQQSTSNLIIGTPPTACSIIKRRTSLR